MSMRNMNRFIVGLSVSVLAMMVLGSPYKDGDTVVFFGDSITHGGRYHAYLTDFYRTRYPDANIRFVNSGIGGDNAGDAIRRIPEDIVEYNPTHVAIHFGMNDVGRRGYREESSAQSLIGREVRQARYRTNMSALISEIRRAVPQAKLLYLTPTHYDDTAVITNVPPNWTGWQSVNQVGCNVGLSLMAGYVLLSAKENGADVLDWFSLMSNFIARRRPAEPSFMLTDIDRVHPNPLGHSLMAWEFLKHQGVSPIVSMVAVDARDCRATSVVNAKVDAVTAIENGGVSFDLLAGSIPFPVPESSLPFVALCDIEKALNREVVNVIGLAPGRYALKIDGESVGEYSDVEFAGGVWLGFNPKTPQYRQAQAVLARDEELRQKEAVFRDHHSGRWFFAKRAPVDDMKAFGEWFEKNVPDKCGYYEKFVPGYLEYWPKRAEERSKLWLDQQAVRLLAKPVKRHYELVPTSMLGMTSGDGSHERLDKEAVRRRFADDMCSSAAAIRIAGR